MSLPATTNRISIRAEQEMRTRLQPILQKELTFAARVCKLDKQQRQVFAEAGKEALKKASYQYTQEQRNAAHPGVMIVNAVRNTTQPNPVKMLQTALLDAAKEKLSPEMQQSLTDEYAKRAAYRKQSVIENVVVLLDKKLGLTQQQRRDITKSLVADWDEGWIPPAPGFHVRPGYLSSFSRQMRYSISTTRAKNCLG